MKVKHNQNTSKQIGSVAVDSGQLIIIDPSYLGRWKDNEFDDKSKKGELSYSNACDITLKNKNQGGTIGNSSAVVFCSGFGDGVYPVIAHYKDYNTNGFKDKRIHKIEIILIEDKPTLSKIQKKFIKNPCPNCHTGKLKKDVYNGEAFLFCNNCDLTMDGDGGIIN